MTQANGAAGRRSKLLHFLRRRPVATAAIAAALTFIAVHGSQQGEPAPPRSWPVYLVLGVTVYVTVGFVLSFRYPALAGAEPQLTRLALALAPAVIAASMAAFGGPAWAAWAGLLASYLLLIVFAVTGQQTAHRESSGEPPA